MKERDDEMKIQNFGTSGINPYKRQMNKIDATNKSLNKTADKIEISTTAKEMQQIPAQRQARVDELKLQVENGTYKANPYELANSIYNFYFKN